VLLSIWVKSKSSLAALTPTLAIHHWLSQLAPTFSDHDYSTAATVFAAAFDFLGRNSALFFTSSGQDHTAFGLATVALENRAVCRQTRCRLLLIGHLPIGEMTW